jgi:hypothetical protein
MKTTVLTLLFTLFFALNVFTQTSESVALKAGQQKTAKKSKLKIKFLSVTEDSRCPVGTNCIWAGNAKIKDKIIGMGTTKEVEFNTNMGPKGDIFESWSITIDSLTPEPRDGVKLNPTSYKAKFTIVRLQR